MSGFGYNVLGFGASASAGGLGVGISLGYNTGSNAWSNMSIQAGDLAISVLSNLSAGASFTNPSGYTTIAKQAAFASWSAPNVEGVGLFYRILDGTESSAPAANPPWIVVRYAKPVSSVVVSSTSVSNSAGITYSYPASDSESVLRMVCSGGYRISGDQRDDWANNGNEIASSTLPGTGSAQTPAGFMVTTSQGSGQLNASAGSFIRACVATTITPSA